MLVLEYHAGVQLIRLFRRKRRVALLVAEELIVDTVAAEFLGRRHTEALADIRFEYPAGIVIDHARRPCEGAEQAVHRLGAHDVNRV